MHLLCCSCCRVGIKPRPVVGQDRGQGSSHPPGDAPKGLPGPVPPGLPSVCWLAAGSASPGEACRGWKCSECIGNKSMG